MRLSIYSIEKTIFEGEVRSASIPTPLGEMTVLDHHLPLISLVSAGTIQYTNTQNARRTLLFNGGILEVRPGSEVIILADVETKRS